MFCSLGMALFIIFQAGFHTRAYHDFLFGMACSGREKEILSVNTFNIENVDFFYSLLYREGKRINRFLIGKKHSYAYTSYTFRGKRMRECDVALFLYNDINDVEGSNL